MTGPVRKVSRSQIPESLTDWHKNLPQIWREATEAQGPSCRHHARTRPHWNQRNGPAVSRRHQRFNRRGILHLSKRLPERTLRHERQAAARTGQQPSPAGGKGRPQLEGEWPQAGSSVTREKRRHISPSPWANNLHWADVFSLINCHSGAFLI